MNARILLGPRLATFLFLMLSAGCERCQSADALRLPGPRCIGLCAPDGGQGVYFSESGTQILMRFRGTGLSVGLSDVERPPVESGRPAPLPAENPIGANQYDVEIDGGAPSLLKMDGRKTDYILADGLAPGEHEICLTKRTEAQVHFAHLAHITLSPNSSALPAPSTSSRQMVLVGDSITAGYGNLGADSNCAFSPDTENARLSYGMIAARTLGAEAMLFTRSGRGITRSVDGRTDEKMQVLWDVTTHSGENQSGPPRMGASKDAQALIINLGTNDFATGPVDHAKFVADYVSFAKLLHETFKKAHIFLCAGPMLRDEPGASVGSLSSLKRSLEEVRSELKKDAKLKVDVLEFPKQTGALGFGCDYHPNLRTHAQMAKVLVEVLREKVYKS